MSGPTISVIVPAYNHAAYIIGALESVLSQTLGDLELIVIDDASRDGTWEAIQTLRDPRLRAFRHTQNQGAHATLNEGLVVARGDFLAILNSDDTFHPQRLERLVGALGDQACLAFSDVDFMYGDGHPAPDHERARDYAAACTLCAAQPPSSWLLTSNLTITTSNFVFPRSLFQRIGGFSDLRYTHDWEWALRASADAPPLWLREPLLRYRVHPANTLAEDDHWRHVHENAYIQTLALSQDLAGLDAPAACTALLRNPSLPPLATLCFMVAASRLPDQAALRALTRPGPDGWFLPGLARVTGLDERIFRSARRLSEQQGALDAQARLIEERWLAMQQMNAFIAERDIALDAQTKLIDERAATIAHMDKEIADRDACITHQATLIDERTATIARMDKEIADRDAVIAHQARLFEERIAAMEDLEQAIGTRDEHIGQLEMVREGLQRQLDLANAERDSTDQQLDALHRSGWVRLGLALGWLRRIP